MDDNRWFPIQGGIYRDEKNEVIRPVKPYQRCEIPWWLAEKAYETYSKKFGTSQSLDRLAERGGFGREELVWLLKGGK